jgi:predicted molibdopterin-dependent oxidoreductase YjgC
MGFGTAIEESSWEKIRAAMACGEVWGLWVVDRDPVAVWGKAAAAGALKALAFSLYQGSHSNHFVQESRWVLPSCSFAEEESTFTNFEGQVQRTAQAFPPLGSAKADWDIFAGVLKASGEPFPFESARAVFSALASKEKAFAGLDWEGLGDFGKRLSDSGGKK